LKSQLRHCPARRDKRECGPAAGVRGAKKAAKFGKSPQRRISMKIPTFTTAVLAVAMTVIPTYAQRGGVQAQIPFSFVVAGKTFAAGKYTMIAASHQLKIEDENGRVVALSLANEVSGRSAGPNGEIIFHCYGYRCFLAEVWSPTEENGRQLPTPRMEANLQKEQGGTYFAVLGVKPR